MEISSLFHVSQPRLTLQIVMILLRNGRMKNDGENDLVSAHELDEKFGSPGVYA